MAMAGRELPALTRRWMQAHSSAKALKLALLKFSALKAMGAPRLMLGRSEAVGTGAALVWAPAGAANAKTKIQALPLDEDSALQGSPSC